MAKVFTSNMDEVLSLIAEKSLKFVDLRFTDLLGKDQHVTIPTTQVDEHFFTEGKTFDGSSIKGWKAIDESDMILMPDPVGVVLDPFYKDATAIIRCDILSPGTLAPYERDPRSIARRAEVYLRDTGIADFGYFGPEPEFFIFDDVRWHIDMMGASYCVDSQEAAFNSGTAFDTGNVGHRPAIKGGYFSMPPIDSAQDIRSQMVLALEEMNIEVEAHHHEVATACQNEIATRFNSLVKKADEMQKIKYVVRNVAHAHNKTATFMPKPLVGDNGNGMHCHVSLAKDGSNIFAGDQYSGLSETALFFIGGVLKHARALNVFTNPTTNSYKRLIPGYEAPVLLAYSACNRSAAVRVPYVQSHHGKRIEVRFPDPTANPYLAFTSILMAGIDGIQNKIHPGKPMDKNLYDLPEDQLRDIPTVSASLRESVKHLWEDREFLLQGNVFNDDVLLAYVELLNERISKIDCITHPIEFEECYSL